MGSFRMRHTANNLRVCPSSPFLPSMSITALSTAIKMRYVSSETSAYPGQSVILIRLPSYSKVRTEDVMEIPLSCSMAIASEVTPRCARRARMKPACWIAPL